MPTRKMKIARVVAPEWRGFPGRLRYAIEQRMSEDPSLTQNKVGEKAGVDGGNLSRMLSGAKAAGVTANTVILLARALNVRPAWLLLGEEPSWLSAASPAPSSERRPTIVPNR